MSRLENRRGIIAQEGFAVSDFGSQRAAKKALEDLQRGRPSKCELRSERRKLKQRFPGAGSIDFVNPTA